MRGLSLSVAAVAAILVAWLGNLVCAQTASFVAPPRTIADITAILDQEKPDPGRTAKSRADADANPPASGNLGPFYFTRCQARATIGRNSEAIEDCQKAIAAGGDYARVVSRYEGFLSGQYRTLGEIKKSIAIEQTMAAKLDKIPRTKGRFFGINLRIALAYLLIGEINQAETYIKKNQALLNESKSWPNVEQFRSGWAANIENGNARLFEGRGHFKEAEAAFRQAHVLLRDAAAKSSSWPVPPPRGNFESTIDFLTAYEGRMKARQGRLAEGEADVRSALLSRLRTVGKYHADTAQISNMLAHLISEQARFTEAQQLALSAVEIYRALGYPEESLLHATALNQYAIGLFTQRRWDEAAEVFARLDTATRDWEPTKRDRIRLGWSRIFTAYNTGKVAEGLELAEALVERTKERMGEKHLDYAIAQGIRGAGLTYSNRDAEAMQAFKAALPVMLTAAREGDYDEATGAAALDIRMQNIAEAYMLVLARASDPSGALARESFRLGELTRGQAVQKAVAASSARVAMSDPALAVLVRTEQDLEMQVAAALGNLNNLLTLPAGERDEKEVQALNAAIGKLRKTRETTRREIEGKFPNYADLVASKPSSAEDVRAVLGPGEAFVSFYFGRRSTFVWAVPKQGQVAFARVQDSPRQLEEKIKKLRSALEPQVAMISEIPPFDVALAHELYTLLLKPVESGWKNSKNLIVVTNGALGLLPLGLLPVAPAELKADGGPLFAGYRSVPWLARSHAVTMIPSASALRTLRQLPPGSDKRERMIGFGDPYFNAQQAAEMSRAEPAVTVADSSLRGVPLSRRAASQTQGVDSAELGLLPRLPDTADELRSIALALQADPSKVLHLGKDANERTVKSAALDKYRIVAFATHGLVPGELNGLTQPALALTAPHVADVDGDGLLTMEEILSLKLDADWVVLSACNTGAGAGAGAEAASGLGRAFFYAGTRALLITNWSVHSQSARELVSDLFRRQAADPKLTRGEALRAAMMSLLDGQGFADHQGKTLFTYGHPLFWAPYSIIGDGGSGGQ